MRLKPHLILLAFVAVCLAGLAAAGQVDLFADKPELPNHELNLFDAADAPVMDLFAEPASADRPFNLFEDEPASQTMDNGQLTTVLVDLFELAEVREKDEKRILELTHYNQVLEKQLQAETAHADKVECELTATKKELVDLKSCPAKHSTHLYLPSESATPEAHDAARKQFGPEVEIHVGDPTAFPWHIHEFGKRVGYPVAYYLDDGQWKQASAKSLQRFEMLGLKSK